MEGTNHRPLKSYRIGEAKGQADAYALMKSGFGVLKLEIPTQKRAMRATASFARLEHLDIGYCEYTQSVRQWFGASSHVRAYMPIAGRADVVSNKLPWASVAPGAICTIPPNDAYNTALHPGSRKLFARIPESRIEALYSAWYGDRPLRFGYAPVLQKEGGASKAFGAALSLLANQLDAGAPALIVNELSQSLAVCFLLGACKQFQEVEAPRSASAAHRQVVLAEEFIEANLAEALYIETLAKVSQCSVRSLFNAFHKVRGYSPTAFIKERRLHRAHNLLITSTFGDRVKAIASLCGFSNAGRFAQDYSALFGELPSETMARSQRKG